VLAAYDRRCAITGSKIRPALRAAHIRPVKDGGEHRLDSGLLLRGATYSRSSAWLPTNFAVTALGVTIQLVEAEMELDALGKAMLDVQTAGQPGQTWTWENVRQTHEASTDPERAQPWAEVVAGRHVIEAEEKIGVLSAQVDAYLRI